MDPRGPRDEEEHQRFLDAEQRRIDSQRTAAIAAGRRKAGAAGAVMAGAMLAISDVLEGPKKDDKPVTVEASDDPVDLDRDGFDLQVGDVAVGTPPLARRAPILARGRKRAR